MAVATPKKLEDAALAERCAAGDRAAQSQLFSRYRALVHGAIYRVFGSNVGIDDAIQDAFVEVFRSLHTYRGEAALGTWIHMLAVRVAYAHVKKRVRASNLELVEPASPAAPDDVAHAREGARRLYRVLRDLAPAARVAFVLSAIEGRSNKEIAEIMESTELATKVRVWRARREVDERAAEDPVLASFLSQPGAS